MPYNCTRPLKLLPVIFVLSAFITGCTTNQKSVSNRPSSRPVDPQELEFRREVVRYALALQGSAYKYAGTSPHTGFDCSGFTSYVMRQFKVTISPASSAQSREGRAVDVKAVQPGDLIIFGKNRNNIQHVALVIENGRKGIEVIHSTTSRGVIRENISTSSYWEPRILLARDVLAGRR